MIRYSRHWPCGTYMREASFCDYCWSLDLPLYKFWVWANDAAFIRYEQWDWYEFQVADYIESHVVKELTA